MKEAIEDWINTQCPLDKGIELYSRYGNSPLFLAQVKTNPERFKHRLWASLYNIYLKLSADTPSLHRDKFRAIYPFLSRTNCPHELKILANEKISTYWRVYDLHKELFSCNKNSDCLRVAKELVETWLEDRQIKEELDYYKEHNSPLEKHRIWNDYKKLKGLKTLSIRQLCSMEKSLQNAIWRLKKQLTENKQPHLYHSRKQNLYAKEKELAQIRRILDS